VQGRDVSDRGLLDADMQTIGGWASDGWRWWVDELAEMVPRRWRERGSARRALADFDAGTGDIVPRHGGAGGAAVAVILPPDFCLTRIVERPAMRQRDLESMLALESDRILPLGAGSAVVAARIVADDAPHRRMRVEVAAVPNAGAVRLAAALARLPRPCRAVYTHAPEPGQPVPVDLLPALRRGGFVGGDGNTARALWLCVAFAFTLDVGLLVWRDAASIATLSDIVAEQQPAVDTARRIIARIGEVDRFVATTLAQRRQRAPLALLGQLATAVPAGVWLQRAAWQGDTVRIDGYRPPLADVSAALRRAGFAVIRYSETASSGQNRLGTAFEITLRVRPAS